MHERVTCSVCKHEFYAPVSRGAWCPRCGKFFHRRCDFPTIDEIRYEGKIWRVVNERRPT